MRAKQYLGLIEELDNHINEQLKRKPEIFTRGTKITQENDGMPHAPGISDKVGSCATELAAIDELIDLFVDFKNEIEGQINKLVNENEREVLEMYYVDGLRMTDIADMMNVSVAWVVKLKNRGEAHIKILRSEKYKCVKNVLKL